MRLTCPNCGAQYEVPDDVIPTGGRDVQCSNCGSTWFQVHADDQNDAEDEQEIVQAADQDSAEESSEVDAAEADADAATTPTDDLAADNPDVFEEVEPPEISITDADTEDTEFAEDEDPDDIDLGGADWDLEPEDDWQAPSEDDEAALEEVSVEEASATEDEIDAPTDLDTSEPETTARARGLDDAVKDILREEAAYESQARAAEEPQSLETQGELGIEQAEPPAEPEDRRASEAQARMRRLRGEDDNSSDAPVPPVRSAKDPRRELLPDIEEINSTLRSGNDGQRNPDLGQAPDRRAKRSRGFRLGFVFVILIAAAAVFVYSSHESLSQSYPQAAPYIEQFMASANGTRIWLDDQVTSLFLKLDEFIGQS